MKKNKTGLLLIICGIIIILLSSIFYFSNNKTNTNGEEKSTDYSFVKSNDKTIKSKVVFKIPNGLKQKESINNDFYNYYENEKGDFLSAYIVDESKTISEYVDNTFKTSDEIYQKRGYKVTLSDIECKYTCKRYTIYNNDDTLYGDELRIFIKTSPDEIFDYIYHLDKEELSDSMINDLVNDIKFSQDATYLIGTVNGGKLNLDFKINDKKNLFVELDTKKYEEIENKNNNSKRTYLKDKESSLVIYLSVEYKEASKTVKEYINEIYNNGKEPVDELEIKLDKLTIHKYTFDEDNYYIYEIDDNHILFMEVKDGMLNTNDFNNITINNKN